MFEGYNEEWNNMTIKKLKEHYPKSKRKMLSLMTIKIIIV